MNVVFSIRVIITSIIITAGIIIPRILQYFQLDMGALDALTSPWATFLILLLALFILLYTWLKHLKFFLVFLAIAVLVAFGLTMYFCQMALPW